MSSASEQVAKAVAEAVAAGRLSPARAEILVGRMLFDAFARASGPWREELEAAGVPANLIADAQRDARVITVRFDRERDAADRDVRRVIERLSVLGEPSSWEPAVDYDSLALAVIDSVWSIGVRYGGVLNVLTRYREYRAAEGASADSDTPQMLLDAIELAGGPEAFAVVLGNRQRTSSRNGILKADAVHRQALHLVAAGVATPGDLAALDERPLGELRSAWVSVPGQRSGLSWNYFLMLARMPGVKADRMIRRFVAAALGRPSEHAVSPAEAARLVTAAAAQLGVEDRVLDYAIWRYQSGK